MYAVYYWPFSSAATPPTPPPAAPKVGWFAEWDKKRTIPVEQLREILKAQGSPWADELADTYRVTTEKRLASPKSKKHREVIERAVQKIVELAPVEMEWGPALEYLRAANDATRTTLAIKNFEAALRAMEARLKAQDEDDEEAMSVLMSAWMNG